jgi:hypothetical protein
MEREKEITSEVPGREKARFVDDASFKEKSASTAHRLRHRDSFLPDQVTIDMMSQIMVTQNYSLSGHQYTPRLPLNIYSIKA